MTNDDKFEERKDVCSEERERKRESKREREREREREKKERECTRVTREGDECVPIASTDRIVNLWRKSFPPEEKIHTFHGHEESVREGGKKRKRGE